MFDQAVIGITLILIDGTILKANPALCTMFGYSESELVRRNFLELVHPDDQTISKQAKQDLLSSELQHPKSDYVNRHIRKDGTAMWGHVTIALVRDAEAKPIYFVTMIEDITERKLTEIRLTYLSRVYAMLSGINTLIVHTKDRDELFQGACRIAVDEGGFRMAMLCISRSSRGGDRPGSHGGQG